MEMISQRGRSAVVYRVAPGLVCKIPKSPPYKNLVAEFKNSFAVEKQLLQRLGSHPRIVRYCGTYQPKGMQYGLLFDEANCGDIRSYINQHNDTINNALRRKWSLQIAEAVAYVHQKGIIHSDIGTSNILVHQTSETIDLVLIDFGGSTCLELDLSGHAIPGNAFLDPKLAASADFKTPKLDIFSLGVVIYIIMTGYYPFYQGPAPQHDECTRLIALHEESARAQAFFNEGKFPDLSGVQFQGVIAGCCCERQFETADEVVVALKAEMLSHASQEPIDLC